MSLFSLFTSTWSSVLVAVGAVGVAFTFDRAWHTFCIGLIGFLCYQCYQMRWVFMVQQPKHQTQMWGRTTIPQGQKWNISHTNGTLSTVSGPDVVHVWGATLLRLNQFSAMRAQYLLIHFLDGQSEIIRGPAQIHMDCSIHKDVKVKDATSLIDGEVLVVYRDENAEASGSDNQERTQRVSRHIIRGPCLHVPKNATEWTHEFSWHGSTSNDPAANGRKIKGAMKFSKLRICPEQSYYDVEGVRTNDDALVTVKVMVFYRLKDLETMLKETQDPPADFMNSVTSDIIDFVAGKSFEEFKLATDQLNDLAVYQQLTSCAKNIGFEVTRVVFRGYGAPASLQKMHDAAIERRTRLALDRESEDQEQRLQDMKLEHEEQRLRKRRQMDMEEKDHQRQVQRAAHEAKLQEILESRESHLQHLSNIKKSLDLSSEQLASYLVASEHGPPGKLVQIVDKGMGSGRSSFIIQDGV